MQRSKENVSWGQIFLAIILVAFMTASAAAAKRPQPPSVSYDGFGIMVNLRGGVFAVQNGSLYQFDPVAAVSMFDNSFDGTVDCVDSYGSACSTSQAPAAPTPDPLRSGPAVTNLACTFLSGGVLPSSSYMQPIYAAPYLYRYHYSLRPKSTVVAPMTAWNLVPPRKSTKPVSIVVRGEILNEAVSMLNPATPSFSFPAANLVSNLHLYLNGQPVRLGSSVLENCPGCVFGDPGSVDFNFAPIAVVGSFNSFLQSGDARTILGGDADSRNDDGGPMGSSLAETVIESEPLELAPGHYSLNLTGTSYTINFSVGAAVHVLDANSCSVD